MEMNFEVEKLKLQVPDSVRAVADNVVRSSTYSENKLDVQKWLPTFRAQTDDITLSCLSSSTRNKLSKIPEHVWICLVGILVSTCVDFQSHSK
ncbi:hypothetical protein CDAR_13441 [Caerostris darwini]|uniref:Uncharacterized protein n=1 Tax=Caerostris darwini TaxID=1538125 RepID=A0AAV4UDS9_9ARAC|nr:hypothetical protein CDAR_13441 [Caerostris darwini]